MFDLTWGLADPTLHVFTPFGIDPTSTANAFGWGVETDLDVQWSHAVAPHANIALVVAKSNNDADINNAIKYAVDNNIGDVISMSFGEGERCMSATDLANQHAIFEAAEAKNITLFASSGDQGSAQPACDGSDSFFLSASTPATDPDVTAVGGTNLFADGVSGAYQSETTWNETAIFGPAASGGGHSVLFRRPDFQAPVVKDAYVREVPDVAYNAGINGGVIVRAFCPADPNVCGAGASVFFRVGGTSAGSPQWAGLIALADQMAGGRVGGINKTLYHLGKGVSPSTYFHDITTGNNGLIFIGPGTGTPIAGFDAVSGYDMATGWGSPIASALVPAIAKPGTAKARPAWQRGRPEVGAAPRSPYSAVKGVVLSPPREQRRLRLRDWPGCRKPASATEEGRADLHRRQTPGASAHARLRLVTFVGLVVAALAIVVGVQAATSPSDDGSTSVTKYQRLDPKGLSKVAGWKPAWLTQQQEVTVVLQFTGAPVAQQDGDAKDKGNGLTEGQKDSIRSNLKAKQDAVASQVQAAGGQRHRDLPGRLQRHGRAHRTQQLAEARVDQRRRSGSARPDLPSRQRQRRSVHRRATGVAEHRQDRHGREDRRHRHRHRLHPRQLRRPGHGRGLQRQQRHDHRAGHVPDAPRSWAAPTSSATTTTPTRRPGEQRSRIRIPNPLDCNGHGSHVAGTAAGFGVLCERPDLHRAVQPVDLLEQLHDRPGRRPGRETSTRYRVFGCAGSTSTSSSTRSTGPSRDGMDVINMSLGSDFGGADEPDAVAADNAAHAGVVVVASAGNEGPNAYITGSPGTATRAISVAAIDASTPDLPGREHHPQHGQTIQAINANDGGAAAVGRTRRSWCLRNPPTAPSAWAATRRSTPARPARSSSTVRGTCARVARAIYGQQAGAVAVVMINTANAFPPFEGPITSNPDTGEPVQRHDPVPRGQGRARPGRVG